jgi:RimJ/RimL family protein N-acetyltransferase
MAGRVEAKVIHTARLTLRSLRSDDAPAVTEVLRDFEVARWLTQVPHPYALSDAEDYLREPEAGTWVIEDAEGLAGMLSVNWKLGYWLAPRVWGRGYIAEAVAPLLARHFSDPNAPDILAGCMTGNARSLAILRRLGFQAEGSKKITPISTGVEIDLPLNRLTRPDWFARNGLPMLATPRLRTRELVSEDAAMLAESFGTADVAAMLSSVKLGWSQAEAADWIARAPWRDRPGFRLGVTRWDGELIGVVGLFPVSDENAADTMFAIDPRFWGQGYATEIMARFLSACFALFDLTEITADHFADNPASGRVLNKLGLRPIGEGIGHSTTRLEPAPVSLYRLKRDELRVGQ